MEHIFGKTLYDLVETDPTGTVTEAQAGPGFNPLALLKDYILAEIEWAAYCGKPTQAKAWTDHLVEIFREDQEGADYIGKWCDLAFTVDHTTVKVVVHDPDTADVA